jgi:hypothetical protein
MALPRVALPRVALPRVALPRVALLPHPGRPFCPAPCNTGRESWVDCMAKRKGSAQAATRPSPDRTCRRQRLTACSPLSAPLTGSRHRVHALDLHAAWTPKHGLPVAPARRCGSARSRRGGLRGSRGRWVGECVRACITVGLHLFANYLMTALQLSGLSLMFAQNIKNSCGMLILLDAAYLAFIHLMCSNPRTPISTSNAAGGRYCQRC